jgi:hypothetical protein
MYMFNALFSCRSYQKKMLTISSHMPSGTVWLYFFCCFVALYESSNSASVSFPVRSSEYATKMTKLYWSSVRSIVISVEAFVMSWSFVLFCFVCSLMLVCGDNRQISLPSKALQAQRYVVV